MNRGMTDKLLADASRCGLFHLNAEQRTALVHQATAAGLRLHRLDLSECRSPGSCLQTIGEILSFPDWYGANLDALVDCLCDPDWQASGGDILMLAGVDRLRKADRKGTDKLLEALSAASAECSDNGRPLWILVDRPLSGVPPFPER